MAENNKETTSQNVERPQLMPGDIYFTRDYSSKLSGIFAWFMKSWVSHCGVIHHQTDRNTYCIETSNLEVGFADFDRYLKSKEHRVEVWRLCRVRTPTRLMIAHAPEEVVETLYGYLQLLTLALRRLLMRLGLKIPNFIRQGMVCTAIPLIGLRRTKIKGLTGIDPESIDTAELRDVCIDLQDESGSQVFKCVFIKWRGQLIAEQIDEE